MLSKLLLPNKFKAVGWVILIVASLLFICSNIPYFENSSIHATVFAMINDGVSAGGHPYFSFIHTDISFTLLGVLFIVGGLFVGFSKEKNEDEYIAKLRLSSLLWAVLVNYLLLLFAFLFVYGFIFLNIMLYNMFTVLLIFIIRFNYLLFINKRSVKNEK